MTPKLFQSLYGRLAAALAALFFILCLIFATLLVYSSRNYEKEVSQQMHLGLAQYVADNYTFFKQGQPDLEAAKNIFHDLMIFGPNFEFYLLDTQGAILAYSADPNKIKRLAINIEELTDWKNRVENKGFIKGDDPRSEKNKKIFSLAPIINGDKLQGYLYVILGSQIQESIEQQLWGSKIIQWGLMAFAAVVVFAGIAMIIILSCIMRPLARLTQQIRQLRRTGFKNTSQLHTGLIQQLNTWRPDNNHDIHLLGHTFKLALQRLEQQYQNVVSIDDLRKELLSHLSHDLRTPLASLLGYLETWELQQDTLTKAQSDEYIAIAKRNAQKISLLIEQLFELAHLDGSNVQVNLEPFAIAELVQDVLQKFSIAASNKNISLSVTPHDSSIQVRGDVEKMERVFTNLIENAMRHTQENGKILIKIEKNSAMVSIHVSDTGIGIPEKDLPYIFDAHFKAGNSVRENTAHGGLGLAITKKLLALHESVIKVNSKMNQGTTFSFSLPKA